MKQYIYHNKTKELSSLKPEPLPKNWENVSNFNALDDNTLISYDWYPYYEIRVGDGPVEDHSSLVFTVSSAEYITYYRDYNQQELDEQKMQLETTMAQLSAEELQKEVNETAKKWRDLRDKRNRILRVTDYHILPDRWETMTSDEKNIWTTYRQALRDVPNNTIDIDHINWPVPNTNIFNELSKVESLSGIL